MKELRTATTMSNLEFKLKYFNVELKYIKLNYEPDKEFWTLSDIKIRDVKVIGNLLKTLKIKFKCFWSLDEPAEFYFTDLRYFYGDRYN